MMRVLFLDIDGVLLCGEDLHRTRDHRYLCRDRVGMINEVCARTGAVVVVSSTWRMWDHCRDLLLAAGLKSLHPDWRTGKGRKVGEIWIGASRGEEIADWLGEHPEVSGYAIVDDDSDMLPEQKPFFVNTPFQTGLAWAHVRALVSRLNTPPPTTGERDGDD